MFEAGYRAVVSGSLQKPKEAGSGPQLTVGEKSGVQVSAGSCTGAGSCVGSAGVLAAPREQPGEALPTARTWRGHALSHNKTKTDRTRKVCPGQGSRQGSLLMQPLQLQSRKHRQGSGMGREASVFGFLLEVERDREVVTQAVLGNGGPGGCDSRYQKRPGDAYRYTSISGALPRWGREQP